MITIENCTSLDIKGELLNIRGSTLFQGKHRDIFMAKYVASEQSLQLFYSAQLQINVRFAPSVASTLTPEQIQSIFPQYFFRLHSQGMMQFFNFKMVSFLQMTSNAIILLFSNGVPITITIDEANVINIYSQCATLHELVVE